MDYLFFFLLSVASSVSKVIFTGDGAIRTIKAVKGHNSTLPCSKATELELSVLQWIRSDLDKRLLVFRGAVLEGYEDSLYRNRVELLDPQLQDEDLSVVLKVVTVKDSGTYRCKAVYEDDEEVQEVSQFIRLTVTEHERDLKTVTETNTDEDDKVALVLLLPIPVIALFVFFQKRSKEQFVLREPPSSEESKEHPALSSNSSSSSLASSASTAALIPNPPPPSEQSSPKPPPYSWSPPSLYEA